MGKRPSVHYRNLPKWLKEWADDSMVEFMQFSEYHMRLTDSTFNSLDIWTTGKYYAKQTDYNGMIPEMKLIERGGETGVVPVHDRKELELFLHTFFYPMDLL